LVRQRFAPAAAAVTPYGPEHDEDGKAGRAVVAIIRELAKH
jgi:hypothetical protein